MTPARAVGESGSPDFVKFKETLQGVFDLRASKAEAAAFAGAARWSASRTFVLVELEASAGRLTPALSGAPEAAAIACLDEGDMELSADTAPHRTHPGDVLFLDWREPMELRFLSPARLTLLAYARAALSERFATDGLWHGLTLAAESPSAQVLAAALRAFARGLRAGAPAEAEALAAGLADLAVRAGQNRLRDLGAAPAEDALVTFLRVRRFVDSNLGSTKLDTAMIARAFGLSRASLYRLFEPCGGVATYLRKARLSRARRLLASPQLADHRIADIAHQAGFRSATVFNRLFRSEFGATPSEARARSLRGPRETKAWTTSADGDLAIRLRELK